jgi:hypothetical protein
VIPSTEVVRQVLDAIENAGLPAAIGGSGLLAALGLVQDVRDWDVTTEGDLATVEAALRATGYPVSLAPPGDPRYRTRARYLVDGGDHEVDVMVDFAVATPGGIEAFATRVTQTWLGLPIGDPAVWARAYRAIDRPARAAVLEEWLATNQPT